MDKSWDLEEDDARLSLESPVADSRFDPQQALIDTQLFWLRPKPSKAVISDTWQSVSQVPLARFRNFLYMLSRTPMALA